jgi:hypothetical protein
MKYFCEESVFNRSKLFFCLYLRSIFKENFSPTDCYISSNFDTILETLVPEIQEKTLDKTIDEILNLDLRVVGFNSSIIKHKSMYNKEEINSEYILKLCKIMTKVHIYEHFFLWFEDYLKIYFKTMDILMVEDGFIPKTWRYYIAIMAASAMKSEYLFKTLEDAFLECGGDESWLIYGLDVIPEKLSKLSRINNILAHQPWKMITEDIKVRYLKSSITK